MRATIAFLLCFGIGCLSLQVSAADQFTVEQKFIYRKVMPYDIIELSIPLQDASKHGIFGTTMTYLLGVLKWLESRDVQPTQVVFNIHSANGKIIPSHSFLLPRNTNAEDILAANATGKITLNVFKLRDLLNKTQRNPFKCCNRESYVEANKIFRNWLTIPRQVKRRMPTFNQQRTLGVHYRGTDKRSFVASKEVNSNQLLTQDEFVQVIWDFLYSRDSVKKMATKPPLLEGDKTNLGPRSLPRPEQQEQSEKQSEQSLVRTGEIAEGKTALGRWINGSLGSFPLGTHSETLSSGSSEVNVALHDLRSRRQLAVSGSEQAPLHKHNRGGRGGKQSNSKAQYDTIYVATDEDGLIFKLRSFLRSIRIVEFRQHRVRADGAATIGLHTAKRDMEQAFATMMDVSALSLCKTVLKTQSAMSAWVPVLSPDIEIYTVEAATAPWFPVSNVPPYNGTLRNAINILSRTLEGDVYGWTHPNAQLLA